MEHPMLTLMVIMTDVVSSA